MGRGHRYSERLLTAAILLLLVLLILRLLLLHDSPDSERRSVQITLLLRNSLQQYILLFTLPYLWLHRLWPLAVLTILLLAIFYLRPLHRRLSRSVWFRLTSRTLTAALVISFLSPYLASSWLDWYYPASALLLLPWAFTRLTQPGARCTTLGLIGLIILQAAGLPRLSLPLLSVWSTPAFFTSRSSDTERPDSPPELWRADGESSLCCNVPIAAPQRLRQSIRHIWYVNGQRVDVISLNRFEPEPDKPWRTWSCKKQLPAQGKISCVASVGAVILSQSSFTPRNKN